MSLKACKEVINERTARACNDVTACGRQFERLTGSPEFERLPGGVKAAIYRYAIDLDIRLLEQALETSAGYEALNDLVAALNDERGKEISTDLAEQLGIFGAFEE